MYGNLIQSLLVIGSEGGRGRNFCALLQDDSDSRLTCEGAFCVSKTGCTLYGSNLDTSPLIYDCSQTFCTNIQRS